MNIRIKTILRKLMSGSFRLGKPVNSFIWHSCKTINGIKIYCQKLKMHIQPTIFQAHQDFSDKVAEQALRTLKSTTPITNTSEKQESNLSIWQQRTSLAISRQNCQTTYNCNQPRLHPQNVLNNQEKQRVGQKLGTNSLYYKNRKSLLKWLKSECVKLELTRQTYANAAFMMDSYYKSIQFNPSQFLCIALCQIIIASKINQKKVIYTERMAQKSSIDVEKMLQTQKMLLKCFRYRMNPYNFATILSEYMLRWDQQIIELKLAHVFPLFTLQNVQSFFIYQQLFYLAQNHFIQYRELLTSTIKLIFSTLITSKSGNICAKQILDRIFSTKNVFARNEGMCVFENRIKSEREQEQVTKKLKCWIEEFQQSKQSLALKYQNFRQAGTRYSEFINMQL